MAYDYHGKAGEAHIVFVFNADTYIEAGETPWAKPPGATGFDHLLDFTDRQHASADILLFFDGRSLECRQVIEGTIAAARNTCEMWVHYEPSRRMGRRVAWSADNREVDWVRLAVPRTAISTKHRNADGSTTTHESCFTNVKQAPWDSLARIIKVDREEIIGVEPSQPLTKLYDSDGGVPLFWTERTPVSFWNDILFCLDAKMVVDMSLGSGVVGRAAIKAGTEHVVACRSKVCLGGTHN